MKKLLLVFGIVLYSFSLSLPVLAQDVDVYEHEDGSVTAVDSDGNAAYVDADGSTTVVDSDGNVAHEDADGSTTVIDTDGNVAHEDIDGNTTILVNP
jgi:hypothetical protein